MKLSSVQLPAGINTRTFLLDSNVLPQIPEVLKNDFPGKAPWLIADGNTWQAAGKKINDILQANGISQANPPKIFPGFPRLHPHDNISQELAANMNDTIVPIAIGSGVINDLVKRASGLAGIPYCCVATACSVDGYTSNGAAMSVDGSKKTLPCPAPTAIIADTEVLNTAPAEMLSAGYGDLFTKICGGADWLIAEALNIEPREMMVWDMVQKDLRLWLSDPKNLGNIFKGLTATGCSMQFYSDSRPASGAEHLFSHVWEMEMLTHNGDTVSHGFQVSIGLIAATQLQYFIINTPVEEAKKMCTAPLTRAQREQEIAKLLEKGCYGDSFPAVAMAKFLDGDAIQARRQLIWSKWEALRPTLKAQLYPLPTAIDMLKKAGAPTHYSEIGLSREQYLHAIPTAQLIRKRYTVLDFLYEAGLLQTAMNTLA